METITDPQLIKQYPLLRNGAAKINFISNVRDEFTDIRRKNRNKKIKELYDSGYRKRNYLFIGDTGESYTVQNSNPSFGRDDKISVSEIIETLPVQTSQKILNIPTNNMSKESIIRAIKAKAERNKEASDFLRREYASYTSRLRTNNMIPPNYVNSTLLISNKYRYKTSHFEGMDLNDILQSLFDFRFYTLFITNRVLKGKETPETRVNVARDTLIKLKYMSSTEEKRAYLEKISQENNTVLKENAVLVLGLLFKEKNPFYIDKNRYSILSYHQENQDDGVEAPITGPFTGFSIYPIDIYIELTEAPPDKITGSDIQKSQCHIRKEKMRKNWFDIWHPSTGTQTDIFERKHRRTLKRNTPRRGGGKKKTRKNLPH